MLGKTNEKAEKEFFEELTHAILSPSKNHRSRRIAGLEELQRRISSGSIQDKDKAIEILLDMAKKQGNNQPESSLIIRSLELCIQKYEEAFQTILKGLGGQEGQLFICFSKLVLSLDYNKKRQAIPYLVGFLMTRDALNSIGIKEVYDCLVSLGNEKLSKEIVNAVSPHLDAPSSKMCAIIYSTRLCAKFADNKLSPKIMGVLKKSMDGYFQAHQQEIERDICQFFERVEDDRSLLVLLDLLKVRTNYLHDHITRAVAKVLDTHPNSVEYLLEVLYDNRRNSQIIYAILECFIEMQDPKIPVHKLLDSIRLSWWKDPYLGLRRLLNLLFVKMGKMSKPTLFEIILDEEKFDFALECLKEIGMSNEELSKIFPSPPMLQIYNFLYSEQKKKIPKDLNLLWEEKEKLDEKIPGDTDRFEHLLLHIFASFNFATLNVAPMQIKSVDVVCFHPETLNFFILGCTTGTLQDDLIKMDSLMRKMQKKVPELFHKCSVTPIVAYSEVGNIHPSHEKYAAQNNIVIMQREDIDILLEMLITNRESREVIEYIKSLKEEQSSLPSM